MFSATVESGLVETMHEKKSFQADSVAVKMERHPGSLPHCLCSSWIAVMVTGYGTVDHCQNYQIEFSRGKFRKVVSAIEDDFNFDSRAAWISVTSKCTSTCFGCKCLHFLSLRCITIWKVKVIIWVNFLISFIAAVRTVVVQLIIFLFYWSGAKNNLPPGILNLFHRLESMRTLRICKCIFKLDNERLRSVCFFLCACKPCCSVNDLTMETKSKWIHAQGPEEFENLSSLSLRAKKDSLVPSTMLILIILALNFRSWRYIPQC